jgi:NADH:ubiquinone oxidoreductase subunit E
MYGISKKDGRRNNTSQFKPFGIRRIQVLELAYMKEDMEDIAKVLGLPIRRVERYIRAYRLGIRLKYT